MAEIHILPGVERRDLGDSLPSEAVLLAAVENGVMDAIVIGKDRAGDLYIASSMPDADRVVGALMRAVTWLSSRTIERSAFKTEPKEPA